MRYNRNKYDIHYMLLKALIDFKEPVRKTKLCYKAKLNPDAYGTRLINELRDSGLISEYLKHYTVTDKGISYVIQFSGIYDLLQQTSRL